MYIKLAIHRSSTNVQQVLALIDTGVECPLLHGYPEEFPGPEASVDGYGGHSVRAKAAQFSLGIGCLLPTL